MSILNAIKNSYKLPAAMLIIFFLSGLCFGEGLEGPKPGGESTKRAFLCEKLGLKTLGLTDEEKEYADNAIRDLSKSGYEYPDILRIIQHYIEDIRSKEAFDKRGLSLLQMSKDKAEEDYKKATERALISILTEDKSIYTQSLSDFLTTYLSGYEISEDQKSMADLFLGDPFYAILNGARFYQARESRLLDDIGDELSPEQKVFIKDKYREYPEIWDYLFGKTNELPEVLDSARDMQGKRLFPEAELKSLRLRIRPKDEQISILARETARKLGFPKEMVENTHVLMGYGHKGGRKVIAINETYKGKHLFVIIRKSGYTDREFLEALARLRLNTSTMISSSLSFFRSFLRLYFERHGGDINPWMSGEPHPWSHYGSLSLEEDVIREWIGLSENGGKESIRHKWGTIAEDLGVSKERFFASLKNPWKKFLKIVRIVDEKTYKSLNRFETYTDFEKVADGGDPNAILDLIKAGESLNKYFNMVPSKDVAYLEVTVGKPEDVLIEAALASRDMPSDPKNIETAKKNLVMFRGLKTPLFPFGTYEPDWLTVPRGYDRGKFRDMVIQLLDFANLGISPNSGGKDRSGNEVIRSLAQAVHASGGLSETNPFLCLLCDLINQKNLYDGLKYYIGEPPTERTAKLILWFKGLSGNAINIQQQGPPDERVKAVFDRIRRNKWVWAKGYLNNEGDRTSGLFLGEITEKDLKRLGNLYPDKDFVLEIPVVGGRIIIDDTVWVDNLPRAKGVYARIKPIYRKAELSIALSGFVNEKGESINIRGFEGLKVLTKKEFGPIGPSDVRRNDGEAPPENGNGAGATSVKGYGIDMDPNILWDAIDNLKKCLKEYGITLIFKDHELKPNSVEPDAEGWKIYIHTIPGHELSTDEFYKYTLITFYLKELNAKKFKSNNTGLLYKNDIFMEALIEAAEKQIKMHPEWSKGFLTSDLELVASLIAKMQQGAKDLISFTPNLEIVANLLSKLEIPSDFRKRIKSITLKLPEQNGGASVTSVKGYGEDLDPNLAPQEPDGKSIKVLSDDGKVQETLGRWDDTFWRKYNGKKVAKALNSQGYLWFGNARWYPYFKGSGNRTLIFRLKDDKTLIPLSIVDEKGSQLPVPSDIKQLEREKGREASAFLLDAEEREEKALKKISRGDVRRYIGKRIKKIINSSDGELYFADIFWGRFPEAAKGGAIIFEIVNEAKIKVLYFLDKDGKRITAKGRRQYYEPNGKESSKVFVFDEKGDIEKILSSMPKGTLETLSGKMINKTIDSDGYLRLEDKKWVRIATAAGGTATLKVIDGENIQLLILENKIGEKVAIPENNRFVSKQGDRSKKVWVYKDGTDEIDEVLPRMSESDLKRLDKKVLSKTLDSQGVFRLFNSKWGGDFGEKASLGRIVFKPFGMTYIKVVSLCDKNGKGLSIPEEKRILKRGGWAGSSLGVRGNHPHDNVEIIYEGSGKARSLKIKTRDDLELLVNEKIRFRLDSYGQIFIGDSYRDNFFGAFKDATDAVLTGVVIDRDRVWILEIVNKDGKIIKVGSGRKYIERGGGKKGGNLKDNVTFIDEKGRTVISLKLSEKEDFKPFKGERISLKIAPSGRVYLGSATKRNGIANNRNFFGSIPQAAGGKLIGTLSFDLDHISVEEIRDRNGRRVAIPDDKNVLVRAGVENGVENDEAGDTKPKENGRTVAPTPSVSRSMDPSDENTSLTISVKSLKFKGIRDYLIRLGYDVQIISGDMVENRLVLDKESRKVFIGEKGGLVKLPTLFTRIYDLTLLAFTEEMLGKVKALELGEAIDKNLGNKSKIIGMTDIWYSGQMNLWQERISEAKDNEVLNVLADMHSNLHVAVENCAKGLGANGKGNGRSDGAVNGNAGVAKNGLGGLSDGNPEDLTVKSLVDRMSLQRGIDMIKRAAVEKYGKKPEIIESIKNAVSVRELNRVFPDLTTYEVMFVSLLDKAPDELCTLKGESFSMQYDVNPDGLYYISDTETKPEWPLGSVPFRQEISGIADKIIFEMISDILFYKELISMAERNSGDRHVKGPLDAGLDLKGKKIIDFTRVPDAEKSYSYEGYALKESEIRELLAVLSGVPEFLSKEKDSTLYLVPTPFGLDFYDLDGNIVASERYRSYIGKPVRKSVDWDNFSSYMDERGAAYDIFSELLEGLVAKRIEGSKELSEIEKTAFRIKEETGIRVETRGRYHKIGRDLSLIASKKPSLEETKLWSFILKDHKIPPSFIKTVSFLRKDFKNYEPTRDPEKDYHGRFFRSAQEITMLGFAGQSYGQLSPAQKSYVAHTLVHEIFHGVWLKIGDLHREFEGISYENGRPVAYKVPFFLMNGHERGLLTHYSWESPVEDFCEHAALYVLHGAEFKELGRSYERVARKYDFIKDVFSREVLLKGNGSRVEFAEGDLGEIGRVSIREMLQMSMELSGPTKKLLDEYLASKEKPSSPRGHTAVYPEDLDPNNNPLLNGKAKSDDGKVMIPKGNAEVGKFRASADWDHQKNEVVDVSAGKVAKLKGRIRVVHVGKSLARQEFSEMNAGQLKNFQGEIITVKPEKNGLVELSNKREDNFGLIGVKNAAEVDAVVIDKDHLYAIEARDADGNKLKIPMENVLLVRGKSAWGRSQTRTKDKIRLFEKGGPSFNASLVFTKEEIDRANRGESIYRLEDEGLIELKKNGNAIFHAFSAAFKDITRTDIENPNVRSSGLKNRLALVKLGPRGLLVMDGEHWAWFRDAEYGFALIKFSDKNTLELKARWDRRGKQIETAKDTLILRPSFRKGFIDKKEYRDEYRKAFVKERPKVEKDAFDPDHKVKILSRESTKVDSEVFSKADIQRASEGHWVFKVTDEGVLYLDKDGTAHQRKFVRSFNSFSLNRFKEYEGSDAVLRLDAKGRMNVGKDFLVLFYKAPKGCALINMGDPEGNNLTVYGALKSNGEQAYDSRRGSGFIAKRTSYRKATISQKDYIKNERKGTLRIIKDEKTKASQVSHEEPGPAGSTALWPGRMDPSRTVRSDKKSVPALKDAKMHINVPEGLTDEQKKDVDWAIGEIANKDYTAGQASVILHQYARHRKSFSKLPKETVMLMAENAEAENQNMIMFGAFKEFISQPKVRERLNGYPLSFYKSLLGYDTDPRIDWALYQGLNDPFFGYLNLSVFREKQDMLTDLLVTGRRDGEKRETLRDNIARYSDAEDYFLGKAVGLPTGTISYQNRFYILRRLALSYNILAEYVVQKAKFSMSGRPLTTSEMKELGLDPKVIGGWKFDPNRANPILEAFLKKSDFFEVWRSMNMAEQVLLNELFEKDSEVTKEFEVTGSANEDAYANWRIIEDYLIRKDTKLPKFKDQGNLFANKELFKMRSKIKRFHAKDLAKYRDLALGIGIPKAFTDNIIYMDYPSLGNSAVAVPGGMHSKYLLILKGRFNSRYDEESSIYMAIAHARLRPSGIISSALALYKTFVDQYFKIHGSRGEVGFSGDDNTVKEFASPEEKALFILLKNPATDPTPQDLRNNGEGLPEKRYRQVIEQEKEILNSQGIPREVIDGSLISFSNRYIGAVLRDVSIKGVAWDKYKEMVEDSGISWNELIGASQNLWKRMLEILIIIDPEIQKSLATCGDFDEFVAKIDSGDERLLDSFLKIPESLRMSFGLSNDPSFTVLRVGPSRGEASGKRLSVDELERIKNNLARFKGLKIPASPEDTGDPVWPAKSGEGKGLKGFFRDKLYEAKAAFAKDPKYSEAILKAAVKASFAAGTIDEKNPVLHEIMDVLDDNPRLLSMAKGLLALEDPMAHDSKGLVTEEVSTNSGKGEVIKAVRSEMPIKDVNRLFESMAKEKEAWEIVLSKKVASPKPTGEVLSKQDEKSPQKSVSGPQALHDEIGPAGSTALWPGRMDPNSRNPNGSGGDRKEVITEVIMNVDLKNVIDLRETFKTSTRLEITNIVDVEQGLNRFIDGLNEVAKRKNLAMDVEVVRDSDMGSGLKPDELCKVELEGNKVKILIAGYSSQVFEKIRGIVEYETDYISMEETEFITVASYLRKFGVTLLTDNPVGENSLKKVRVLGLDGRQAQLEIRIGRNRAKQVNRYALYRSLYLGMVINALGQQEKFTPFEIHVLLQNSNSRKSIDWVINKRLRERWMRELARGGELNVFRAMNSEAGDFTGGNRQTIQDVLDRVLRGEEPKVKLTPPISKDLEGPRGSTAPWPGKENPYNDTSVDFENLSGGSFIKVESEMFGEFRNYFKGLGIDLYVGKDVPEKLGGATRPYDLEYHLKTFVRSENGAVDTYRLFKQVVIATFLRAGQQYLENGNEGGVIKELLHMYGNRTLPNKTQSIEDFINGQAKAIFDRNMKWIYRLSTIKESSKLSTLLDEVKTGIFNEVRQNRGQIIANAEDLFKSARNVTRGNVNLDDLDVKGDGENVPENKIVDHQETGPKGSTALWPGRMNPNNNPQNKLREDTKIVEVIRRGDFKGIAFLSEYDAKDPRLEIFHKYIESLREYAEKSGKSFEAQIITSPVRDKDSYLTEVCRVEFDDKNIKIRMSAFSSEILTKISGIIRYQTQYISIDSLEAKEIISSMKKMGVPLYFLEAKRENDLRKTPWTGIGDKDLNMNIKIGLTRDGLINRYTLYKAYYLACVVSSLKKEYGYEKTDALSKYSPFRRSLDWAINRALREDLIESVIRTGISEGQKMLEIISANAGNLVSSNSLEIAKAFGFIAKDMYTGIKLRIPVVGSDGKPIDHRISESNLSSLTKKMGSLMSLSRGIEMVKEKLVELNKGNSELIVSTSRVSTVAELNRYLPDLTAFEIIWISLLNDVPETLCRTGKGNLYVQAFADSRGVHYVSDTDVNPTGKTAFVAGYREEVRDTYGRLVMEIGADPEMAAIMKKKDVLPVEIRKMGLDPAEAILEKRLRALALQKTATYPGVSEIEILAEQIYEETGITVEVQGGLRAADEKIGVSSVKKFSLAEMKFLYSFLKDLKGLIPGKFTGGIKRIVKGFEEYAYSTKYIRAQWDDVSGVMRLYGEKGMSFADLGMVQKAHICLDIAHEIAHDIWNHMPEEMRAHYSNIKWYRKVFHDGSSDWHPSYEPNMESLRENPLLGGFITSYSTSSPSEDFADHFAIMILFRGDFKILGDRNNLVSETGKFIRDYLDLESRRATGKPLNGNGKGNFLDVSLAEVYPRLANDEKDVVKKIKKSDPKDHPISHEDQGNPGSTAVYPGTMDPAYARKANTVMPAVVGDKTLQPAPKAQKPKAISGPVRSGGEVVREGPMSGGTGVDFWVTDVKYGRFGVTTKGKAEGYGMPPQEEVRKGKFEYESNDGRSKTEGKYKIAKDGTLKLVQKPSDVGKTTTVVKSNGAVDSNVQTSAQNPSQGDKNSIGKITTTVKPNGDVKQTARYTNKYIAKTEAQRAISGAQSVGQTVVFLTVLQIAHEAQALAATAGKTFMQLTRAEQEKFLKEAFEHAIYSPDTYAGWLGSHTTGLAANKLLKLAKTNPSGLSGAMIAETVGVATFVGWTAMSQLYADAVEGLDEAHDIRNIMNNDSLRKEVNGRLVKRIRSREFLESFEMGLYKGLLTGHGATFLAFSSAGGKVGLALGGHIGAFLGGLTGALLTLAVPESDKSYITDILANVEKWAGRDQMDRLHKGIEDIVFEGLNNANLQYAIEKERKGRYKELDAVFGVLARNLQFWQAAEKVYPSYIEELEIFDRTGEPAPYRSRIKYVIQGGEHWEIAKTRKEMREEIETSIKFARKSINAHSKKVEAACKHVKDLLDSEMKYYSRFQGENVLLTRERKNLEETYQKISELFDFEKFSDEIALQDAEKRMIYKAVLTLQPILVHGFTDERFDKEYEKLPSDEMVDAIMNMAVNE